MNLASSLFYRPPTAPTSKWKVVRKTPLSDGSPKWITCKEQSGKVGRPASVPADLGIECPTRLDAKSNLKESEHQPQEETSVKLDCPSDMHQKCPQAWDIGHANEYGNQESSPEENMINFGGCSADVNKSSDNQGGYGMTLSEYISNMRTTPAASSSFTNLHNEEWASMHLENLPPERVGRDDAVKKKHSDFCSDSSDQSTALDENFSPSTLSPR